MTAHSRANGWHAIGPPLELVLALAAAALWYTTGGAVWYRETSIALWPALLLLPLVPLHVLAHSRHKSSPGLYLWLGLFIVTGCISTWVAYDREVSLAKLGLLIGAAGMAVALSHQLDRRQIYYALAVLGGGVLVLSLYSLMGNDWAAQEAKMPALARLGRQLTVWLPQIGGHRVTPNVSGSMLALLLPFAVALVGIRPDHWLSVRSRALSNIIRLAWALVALVGVLALGLSASRGAWVSVCAVACAWLIWRWSGRNAAPDGRGFGRSVLGVGLILLAGVIAAALAGYLVLLFDLPGAAALQNRIDLTVQGISLAQDYPYTGVGLGLFSIPFSVYTLLIHVGYIVHPHNTYVGVVAEQGVFGLGALVLLWGGAVVTFVRWRRHAHGGLTVAMEACLASTAIMAIHGVVDNGLYGSRGVLLLFASVGLMASCTAIVRGELSRARESEPHRLHPHRGEGQRGSVTGALAAGGVLAVLLLLLTECRPVTAWLTNLGALEQTRLELAVYDPERFGELSMESVRSSLDFTSAAGYLEAAARQPGYPGAPRRLAEIDLAEHEYDAALELMQGAWVAGNRDNTTRLLYGDALLATGDPRSAVRIISGIPWARERLEGQVMDRYTPAGELDQVAWASEAIALLSDDPTAALDRVNAARARAGFAPLDRLP